MAEASKSEPSGGDHDDNSGSERKLAVRPPNKKKFEEEIERINEEIKKLEQEQTKLESALSHDSIQTELQKIRSRKNDLYNNRKLIDVRLQKINKDIMRQNSEMTKVESTLKYKSEERTNETIHRLEQQLELQNFSLREERQIVKEIDALKRSKNVLVQYMAMKKEIENLNVEARKLRQQREFYFKEWTIQKQEEEKFKKQVEENKLRYKTVKHALEELYEKKRVCQSEFKTQSKEYQQSQKRKHEEQTRLREQEKLQRQEAYQKEITVYETNHEPYHEEIRFCDVLLAYLQRFIADSEQSTEKTADQTQDSTQKELEGMYVLKKRTEDELFGQVCKPKGKKTRKDKRRTLSNKPINHSLEIFEKFSSLNITAPPTVADIPQVIQKLEAAKQHYKELSEEQSHSGSWNVVNFLRSLPSSERSSVGPQPKACMSAMCTEQTDSAQNSSSACCFTDSVIYIDSKSKCEDMSATETSSKGAGNQLVVTCSNSVVNCPDQVSVHCSDLAVGRIDCSISKTEAGSTGTESAICDDSVPSTPEVQSDSQPPRFLPVSSPALSEDSGTVST